VEVKRLSARAKRNILRLGLAVIYIAVVTYALLAHMNHAGISLILFVGVIYLLNLRYIRFCDRCGAKNVVKDLSRHSSCRKCGGEVRSSDWC
jgi:NADH pyrophosphatase NudC (nudix superfamily)